MILADKIIQLRKKQGWTQEEFAARMNVSRQAVSKWEGAQAVPDLNKILQMGELFGVTTDSLLKDEEVPESLVQKEAVTVETGAPINCRPVSLEEANRFLELRQKAARQVSLSIILFILALVLLIIFSGGADLGVLPISATAGAAVGLVAAVVLSALGVVVLLFSQNQNKDLAFIGRVPIETAYGVDGLAKSKREEYKDKSFRRNVIGVVVLIFALIPLFLTIFFDRGDITPMENFYAILLVCLAFLIAGCGVYMLVYNGIVSASFNRLLSRGNPTGTAKLDHNSIFYKMGSIIWPVGLIVYFVWSFGFGAWNISWIIFPITAFLTTIFFRLAGKED